jgi:hypothetical protein
MDDEVGRLVLLSVLDLVQAMKKNNVSYDSVISSLEKMIEVYDE